MEATRSLREEHQVILQVLECFESVLRDGRESQCVKREAFEPFVLFFRRFADQCHHAKEEDKLFPVLERNGIPREGGPIGVMLQEHVDGRAHVAAVAEHLDAADRGDTAATETVLRHGEAYLELLRGHIDKEEQCLFEMADQAVRGDDLTALAQAYLEVEGTPEYRERNDQCRAIAARLIATHSPRPGS